MNLDERKKKILSSVVEDYIVSAEPVGSKTIMEKYNLEYSSATIRNDMKLLEEAGYLEQPHVSAGRIPSTKGYRYYVDELLEDNKITVDEIDYISKKLETKVNELEEITQIASSTISEITHYTTVTIGPNTDVQKIENIKFVLLSPRMMMAVILTDNGLVKETIIKFDEDISEKQVETLSYMFNNKLKGEPITKIDRPLEKYLVDEMRYSVNLIKPIIEQMKKVVEEEKVHLEGAKQLFELPEFNSLEVAKNFVNILDEKELMADMLNTGITKDINVYIGEENEKDELKDFSIVTFKHRIGNKDLGTIGIIGPKRMDYAKVISVMKYISKKLNDNNNSNE